METVPLDIHRFKSKKGASVIEEFALFNWSSVQTTLEMQEGVASNPGSGMKATAGRRAEPKEVEPNIVFSFICSNEFKILISFNLIWSYM